MRGLAGKVAIVTGGGSGLGEAIGKALAKDGVNVVLTDVNLAGAWFTLTSQTRLVAALLAAPVKGVPDYVTTATGARSEREFYLD